MARRRNMGLGVWLGILAVAVNALLPIHIAKDIVHAAGHMRVAALEAQGIDAATAPAPHHRHDHPGGTDHHHHDGGCLICAGLSAAATATTLPPPVVIALPMSLALAILPATAGGIAESETHTPYAPRAPPPAA
jgi:hypothetical protein